MCERARERNRQAVSPVSVDFRDRQTSETDRLQTARQQQQQTDTLGSMREGGLLLLLLQHQSLCFF